MNRRTHHSNFPIMCLLLAAAALVGCERLQVPITPKVASTPNMPPDYDLPEAQFVAAKFNTLASEFMDEYLGQYVVFEGRYSHHEHGAFISTPTGPEGYSDVMSVSLAAPAVSGALTGTRTVQVLWSVDDRELGRPFLNLPPNAPVRIYAYVLPAHQKSRHKSRNDIYWGGLPVPVIVLVKAVPVGAPGAP